MDPQMAGLIVFMMGSGFLFVVATLFCWHTLSLRRDRERTQQELRMQLVRAAGSLREIEELLQSERGQALFRIAEEPRNPWSNQFATAMRRGVFVLAISLGLLALAPWMRRTSSWVAFGGLGTAIAVGLMASAAVTERIARRRSGDH
jgi:hypothetical protein